MDNTTKTSDLALKNFKLVLEKAFEEKDFDTLITFVNENEIQLLSSFLQDNLKETGLSLNIGSFFLDHFESQIKSSHQKTAIFKLGELTGYIRLLEALIHEDSQNNWAKAKFEKVLSRLPNYETYLKDILIALSEKVEIQEQKLLDKLPISLTELKEIMDVLEEEGFIHNYTKSLSGYTLTDFGLRLVRQLKNDTCKNL